MGNSIGQIGLDLVVNQGQFKQQMQGITNIAKKAGATLASVFAIKKVIDFGASCIELGSNLSEVQNVVDVTFTTMSKQLDSFAQSAEINFGLSETMAKKFAGTFGAMSKAFGFNEKAAYEMSTTLTGLSGDVASFYNISQDESYTKLKSVFTGETESLKDLGIVMTQSALDAYALANGYGKVTAKMLEAEKVALRYQFVQDQLILATGDFSRTSDGWANQIRILNLQFDSLKATIGQGLINVFTPVVKVVNSLINKLMTLANGFKSFTELLTGKKASNGNTQAAVIEQDANAATNALDDMTTAAKKAKKASSVSSSIDKLNMISGSSSGDSDSGGSTGTASSLGTNIDFGELAKGETVIDRIDSKINPVIEKVKEFAEEFIKGFKVGVGDLSEIDKIKSSIENITKSIINIFEDSDVANAANKFIKQLSNSLGKKVGSFTSIGITIATTLIGGIEKYLSDGKKRIKQFVINIFDITSDISKISGNFSVTISDIFAVFKNETVQQITADIISIFTEGIMGATELVGKLARDLLNIISKPFIDNGEEIKIAISGFFSAIEPVITSIKDFVTNTFTKIGQVYDEHIAPMLQSFGEGFSKIYTTLLDGYNTYVLPVIQGLGEKFKNVMSKHIQPAVDKFIVLFGKISDGIKDIWEKTLQPFINWIAEKIMPIIAPIIQNIGNTVIDLFSTLGDVFGDIMDALSGLIDFIVGVFTGDWKKAWNGIKTFFTNSWNGIKDFLSGIWGTIKNIFSPVSTWFKDKFDSAVSGIKGAFSNIGNFFRNIWDNIKNTFANVSNWFRDTFTKAWEAVKNVFSKGGKIFDGIKNGILSGLKTVINGIISGINKVIAIPFNGLNKALDTLRKLSILGVSPFGWLPTLTVPQIPKLAQGGYVKANTPQLAMIGDNRHQGEVVAPESKLQEIMDLAIAKSSTGKQEILEIIALMRNILSVVSTNKEVTAVIKSNDIYKAWKQENNMIKKRIGR